MQRVTSKIALGVLFFASSLSSKAIPAYPHVVEYTQPDGTVLTISLTGDEHGHYYQTLDRIPVGKGDDGFFRYLDVPGTSRTHTYIARNPQDRTSREKAFTDSLRQHSSFCRVIQQRRTKSRTPQTRAFDFPSRGEVRGLIILAQYADIKFSPVGTREAFEAQMNQKGYAENGATGSARDYFIDQSNGVFMPSFDVVGPVTLSHDMKYYGENDFYGNDLNLAAMITEACTEAHEKCDVNFADYDFDNDGTVDLVYVIYAGHAESNGADENTIWPAAGTLDEFGHSLTLDGKKISTFACSSELSGETGEILSGIGTFCHEFSHCLGLPDIYNTEYGDTFGMGTWSLMDMGSYNNDSKTPVGYSAFERYSCGWLDLQELQEPQAHIALPPLNRSNRACLMRSPHNENEFFTLENRQQTGWDRYAAGHGLMIVHIDYDPVAWDNNTVNNTEGHERVQIVPADGNFTNPEGDLFPGTTYNTYFTEDSNPAPELYSEGALNKPIIDIRESNDTVYFHFMIDRLATPDQLGVTDVTDDGFTATWGAIDGADSYTVTLSEQYPLNTLLLGESFSGFASGTYLMPDTTEISQSLDSYTQQPGWTGERIGQCGGRCCIKAKGYMVSPRLDFSGDGTFTLEFEAQTTRSYYDGLVITLCENADFTGEKIIFSLKSPTSKTLISQTFNTSIDSGYLKIESLSNLALSNLSLYSGEKSTAPKKPVASHAEPAIITGVTDNHYSFTGLNRQSKYLFKIQAQNTYTRSDESIKFKVGNTSAIDKIETSGMRHIATNRNILHIYGQPGDPVTIVSMTGQVLLKRQLTADSLSLTLPSGLFIIRVGDETFKAIISPLTL